MGKGADIVNAQRVLDAGLLFLMQMSESSQRLKCIYTFLCAMGVFTSLLKMIHKCSEICSEIYFTNLPIHSYIMLRTDMCSFFLPVDGAIVPRMFIIHAAMATERTTCQPQRLDGK